MRGEFCIRKSIFETEFKSHQDLGRSFIEMNIFQTKVILSLKSVNRKAIINLLAAISVTSGQSYKASTIVIYASRVVPDLKIPHITTLES